MSDVLEKIISEIASIQAAGLVPTNKLVLDRLGTGSHSTVQKAKAEIKRREQALVVQSTIALDIPDPVRLACLDLSGHVWQVARDMASDSMRTERDQHARQLAEMTLEQGELNEFIAHLESKVSQTEADSERLTREMRGLESRNHELKVEHETALGLLEDYKNRDEAKLLIAVKEAMLSVLPLTQAPASQHPQ